MRTNNPEEIDDTADAPGRTTRMKKNRGGRIVVKFPLDAFNDLRNESARQERSLSWIIQRAWKIARREIMGPQPPPPPLTATNHGL